MAPSKAEFLDFYGDNSGVEYAVRIDLTSDGNEIEICHVGEVTIPLERLDWLIARLQACRDIATEFNTPT